MTTIDPFAAVRTPTTTAPVRQPDDQFGKDTFLKLLVAQLKFQNPLSPADPGDFLAQSAQFTMVEKLIAIEKQNTEAARANEVLASSALIGRVVTASIATGDQATPIATTDIRVGGNLPASAAAGASFETTTDVFTADGTKVPLRLQFVRGADTPNGTTWEMRAFSGSQPVGTASTLTFDASGERTSGDIVIPAAALEELSAAPGPWPPAGINLSFGSPADAARFRVGSGAATASVREQNGSDGLTMSGVVTAVRFTEDGATLRVGNREIPMGWVLEVHPSAV